MAPLRNDPEISTVTNAIFHGNFFTLLGTPLYFYFGNGLLYPVLAPFIGRPWFWSTSFACRKRDFEAAGGYEPLIAQQPRLSLSEWAEDFYLSLRLSAIGRIVFTFATVTHPRFKR